VITRHRLVDPTCSKKGTWLYNALKLLLRIESLSHILVSVSPTFRSCPTNRLNLQSLRFGLQSILTQY
jgi:hypothetical protein